jgi:predicted NBD/HSP70 family sugar kinase
MSTLKVDTGLSRRLAPRRQELGRVLRHVVERGPQSVAAIAVATGLDERAVADAVGDLIELGLLVSRGGGQPAVDLLRDGAVALGLEINVDQLSVQATDLTGRSRYKAIEAVDNRRRGVDVVIGRLADLANGALHAIRAQGLRPIGATVALPGLVDVEHGTLRAAPSLDWSDVPVVGLLRERIDGGMLPLDADNEANLAALAELWEGVAVGLADFLYASAPGGVGGGIVLGKELLRGYRGVTGEYRHSAGLEPEQFGATGPGKPVAHLMRRAREGEPRSLEALDRCGRRLGGYFAPLAEWLRPAIEAELAPRLLGAQPPILPSSLGPEAAVRGAAATQLRRVLADPERVGLSRA